MVMGEKDYQQLWLLKNMIKDFFIPCELVAVETVRDSDGLAMSSRNAFLDESQRNRALSIFRAISFLRKSFILNQPFAATLDQVRAELQEKLKLQYLEIRDEQSMDLLTQYTKTARVFIAGFCGSTRLIDNARLYV